MLVITGSEPLLKNKSKRYVDAFINAFKNQNYNDIVRYANYCANSNEPILAIQSLIIRQNMKYFTRIFCLR